MNNTLCHNITSENTTDTTTQTKSLIHLESHMRYPWSEEEDIVDLVYNISLNMTSEDLDVYNITNSTNITLDEDYDGNLSLLTPKPEPIYTEEEDSSYILGIVIGTIVVFLASVGLKIYHIKAEE